MWSGIALLVYALVLLGQVLVQCQCLCAPDEAIGNAACKVHTHRLAAVDAYMCRATLDAPVPLGYTFSMLGRRAV